MNDNLIKKSLNPIVNDNSKILILGSMAGDKSLETGEYYSNKANQFWDILKKIFDNDYKLETYKDKIEFLNKYNIALWDIYKQTEREGSKDRNIKSTEFNDLKNLLIEYKNIKIILLNGKETEKAFNEYITENDFEKFLQENNIKYCCVFSSSGANAKNIELKVENWKNAIEQ